MTHPIFKTVLSILSGSYRIFKFILSLIIIIVMISTASFIAIYYFFARDLPDIKTLEDYRPPVTSEVFADDGSKIGEFWLECRMFMPYNEIPKRVVQAFVDSEDSRFFDHKGVDLRSIARAFVANLKAGEITQGGSTITQQITRSLLLTREKSVTRKVKEAILATRLERYLNKEQILTLYLNQIYLGNRAYGVAAAARNYFNKKLSDLSLAEISLIAGLPTAPTNFSPINNSVEARRRQMHVLARMYEQGHITKDEIRKAEAMPLTIYVAGIDKEFNDKDAAYFIEHVRRLVKEKYGDETLYDKGLKIYTTVNMPMQRAAVASIRSGIEALDKKLGYRGVIEHVNPEQIAPKSKQIEKEIIAKQAGHIIYWPPGRKDVPPPAISFRHGEVYKAVVTAFGDKDTTIQIGDVSGTILLGGIKWAHPWQPGSIGYEGGSYVNNPKTLFKTGDVILVRRLEDGTFELAQEPLIQSALMAMDPHAGFIKAMVGGYDFAKSEFNRVNQALRQPGSSFKPFVYSSALDKGYTFGTTVVDGPVTFTVGRNEFWTPKNYGGNYNGTMTFKNCITFSRNIPTAKIVFDIGTHYLTAYERKMGITSPIEKYLSMALGANGVYLQEMVQAYTIFLNNGVFKPAIAIEKIEDAKGNVLESATPSAESAGHEPPSSEEKTPEENLEPEKIGKNISPDELSAELWKIGRQSIERDKLDLTDLEIKTLYGANIPPGHVITPQTAYLMVTLLKNVVEGGTGTRVKALGKPAAGKTGTTNDETDVWFIGFVPDLSAGVWVGFDEVQKIGQRVAGGTIAAPIFTDFMKQATKDFEAKDFEKPEGFPDGDINNMAGGSSLFGASPKASFGSPGFHEGGDKAGDFFEEDFESFR